MSRPRRLLPVALVLAALLAIGWVALDEAPGVLLAKAVARLGGADGPDAAWRGEAPVEEVVLDEDGVPVRLRGRPLSRATVERLATAGLSTAGGWIASLSALARARAAAPDRPVLEILDEAWHRARLPVARQNLIFHVALSAPPGEGEAWLEARAAGAGPDAEDALVALAFSGAGPWVDRFEDEASTPDPAWSPALLDEAEAHERVGETNDDAARVRLRPYRAYEVLTRRVYFHRTLGHVAPRWEANRVPDRAAAWLTEAWLRRWPGHPGSDDLAVRLARRLVRRGAFPDAALAYLHALTLSDGCATWEARCGAWACLEVLCDVADLPGVLHQAGRAGTGRWMVQAALLRRLAVERSLADALGEAGSIARAEPDGPVAAAWAGRRQQAPSRALDAGLAPLPAGDPLRRREPGDLDWPEGRAAFGVWWDGGTPGGWTERARLAGVPEPEIPGLHHLAASFRAWEALVDLEGRADRARGEAEADLRYKAAAIPYHDPDVFFPPCLRWSLRLLDDLGRQHVAPLVPGGEAAWAEAVRRFERGALGELVAARAFEALERRHPAYAALDRVVYSEGEAMTRLLGRAARRYGDGGLLVRPEVEARLFRAFARVGEEHPESPLAATAARRHALWARLRPHAPR